jgi:hypothetical protein
MSGTARRVRAKGRRAARNDWGQRAARVGLLVRGAMYVLVGLLALQIATGDRGTSANSTGALSEIARKPLAAPLLIGAMIGFGALAAWRLAEAAFDTDHQGRDRDPILGRGGSAARALLYAGAAVWAASFLLGPRGNKQTDESDLSARIFELPAGRWLIAAIGLSILAACVAALWRITRGEFEDELKLEELATQVRRPAKTFAVIGLVARLLLVALLGLFLIRAAIQHDPRQGVGLDHALSQLLDQPAGPLWVGLAAAALVIFGSYSVFEARYREVLHS